MLRVLGISALVLGVTWAAGTAASSTGFALSGGGSLDISGAGQWLFCGTLVGLMWAIDRRAALMTMSGVGTVIAFGVFLMSAVENHAPAFLAFGGTAFVVAAVSGAVLIRDDRRAARQPNPLRDLAAAFFDDPPIREVGGVQYLAILGREDSPAALQVRVLLQNCHDTPATARVRLEEDVVGEPSVLLPEVEPVKIGAEAWAVLEWLCPARPDHRGEGWFHLSMKVERDTSGRRTHPWRAATGRSSGLKATQLLEGLSRSRIPYVGEKVTLPKVGPELALPHCHTRAVDQAELETLLRDSM